jgi:hypothetical protein
MRGSTRILLAVLIVGLILLAAIVAWNSSIWHSGIDAEVPDFRRDHQQAVGTAAPNRVRPEDSPEATPQAGDAEPRTLAPTGPRVVDIRGVPIAGAELSWTLLQDPGSAEIVWPWLDEGAPSSHARTTRSDSTGHFPGAPTGSLEGGQSVVWLTHTDYAARSFVLEADATLDAISSPIQLEDAEGLTLTVVDGKSEPVAGATVHQRLEMSLETRSQCEPEQTRARWALWRTVVTDSQGTARLGSLPSRQVVDARAGALRSSAWRGVAPAQVTLLVMPTVACVGRVIAAGGDVDLSRTSVRASARVGSSRRWLGATAVHEDGSIGSLALPVVDADDYEFELSGSTCVPTTLHRPTPSAGEVITLDFVARAGTRFPVRVLAPDEEPVAGAVVGWAWLADDNWQWWMGLTDASGSLEAVCVPPGSVWLEVTKQGFLPLKQELEHTGDFSPAYAIHLERGGVLSGVVTSGGAPVRDFHVVYALSDDGRPEAVRVHDVRDAVDGRYEIDGVPVGELAIFAYSDSQQRPATRFVRVLENLPASADFVLPIAIEVTGLVRDARSLEPIRGASVQGWMSADFASINPWGATVTTGADGGFRLASGSPEAVSTIEVSAAGYASKRVEARPAHGASIDLGAIGLVPPSSLRLQIERDEDDSLSKLHAGMHGPRPVARRALDDSGIVEFEGLSPDIYTVVVDNDTTWTAQFLQPLSAIGRTTARLSFRRTRDLAVLIKPAPGESLPPQSVMTAAFRSRSLGRQVNWSDYASDHVPVDIGFLDAERLVIHVSEPGGRLLGTRVISGDDLNGPVCVVKLGANDRELRILDRQGEAVANARVAIAQIANMYDYIAGTDSQGVVRLRGFAVEEAHVVVDHASIGRSVFRSVRFGDDPTELRLDPRGHLRLDVLDDSLPLRSVEVVAFDTLGLSEESDRMISDDGGRATSRPLDAGEPFEVRVEQPGYWPTRAIVTADAGEQGVPLQVRRLGGVTLSVSRGGLPLVGHSLQLFSEEFEADVASWQAESRCSIVPADRRTDVRGQLRLDGIPRGTYHWSTTLDEGADVRGSFEVQPATHVDVMIALP